ncbi:MAG: sulfatase-like hydrolase/transferase [Planctomycetes bacterium]|nr:sulfatase-like hydrolase/transferase [Planctomycetota bacterium]
MSKKSQRKKMQSESESGLTGGEVILGALAIVAVVNFAVVLALKGYKVSALGISVRSHDLGRPLFIAIGFLGGRYLASLARVRFGRSLRSFLPWGPVVALAGLMLFAYMAFGRGTRPAVWPAVWVSLLVLAGFVPAWLAWGVGFPKASRLVVGVVFLGLSMATGASMLRPRMWKKTFRVAQVMFRSDQNVPADLEGLLAEHSQGVEFRKVARGVDWRDSAVVSPGGFFSSKVEVRPGARLRFAVARTSKAAGAAATVTVIQGGSKQALWQEDAGNIEEDAWRDVSVPLPVAGKAEIVFEVNAPSGDAEVLFANMRIAREDPGRPNFIFIIQDAMRADRMGLYGNTRAASPEIDRLAAKAVVFDECIAQAPWTYPSMGTVFTSLYPSAHGLVTWAKGLSDDLETVAERFREGGYFTGAIQANPIMAVPQGLAQGFNEYNHLGGKVWNVEDKGEYTRAEVVTTATLAWLDRHSTEPFFLYIHYMDTHKPYVPVDGYDKFGGDDLSLYDGEIAYFSREFGRLYDGLAARGLLENTVLILTADHGEQFMEHGMTGHGAALHTEELHVPLVIWPPRLEEGLQVKSRVRLIDMAPTMLDLAGLDPLGHAEGKSLRAALGGKEPESAGIYSELVTFRPAGQFLVALTRGHYRFILSNPGGGVTERLELYDLARDSGEYVNIADADEALTEGFRADVEEHVTAQKSLHLRLVPQEVLSALTDEQKALLKALGYLQ